MTPTLPQRIIMKTHWSTLWVFDLKLTQYPRMWVTQSAPTKDPKKAQQDTHTERGGAAIMSNSQRLADAFCRAQVPSCSHQPEGCFKLPLSCDHTGRSMPPPPP